jgi:hypothetical protein
MELISVGYQAMRRCSIYADTHRVGPTQGP